MKERIQKALKNLKKAEGKLENFLKVKNPSEVEMAGVIQAFEYTFELIWKYCQKLAQEDGVNCAGPKASLQYAFQRNLIRNSEEDTFLSMLRDRNLTVHTYNENLANEVYLRVHRDYFPLIHKFVENLESLK